MRLQALSSSGIHVVGATARSRSSGGGGLCSSSRANADLPLEMQLMGLLH